ncbi:coilin isoform X3 [Castor canadensis]|uniref:Coilin isoform X3 n=1 Tax=Castor canadensis TaxID=51338 RepID=A0AC58KBE1_CASCN
MAASETVRLRLQFDYPPPATPHCTVFWLLVDLNRCRVVTDLISLIRQRFGFSSGALLGLYLEGGLLPPTESARLVRDNDNISVKLEESEIPEISEGICNGGNCHFSPRKAKKRAFKLVEDEETEPDYGYSKKHWKRQGNNSNNEKASDLELKAVTDQTVKKKSKRKNKATCGTVDDDDEETKKKSPKRKEKCEYKKQTRNPKSPKAQAAKEWTPQNCSPPKGSAKNSLAKARRKSGVGKGSKGSPRSSSESESSHESTSDVLSNVTLVVGNSLQKLSSELSKEVLATKNTVANKVAAKAPFTFSTSKGKAARASSSSSDSSSESDDQGVGSKSMPECASSFLKTAGLLTGQGCPGPGSSSQTPSAAGWKPSDLSGSKQSPGPPPSVSVPTNLGRGWGRGEDLLSWKGARGRGMRGRGRGRGRAVSCVLNRSTEYQKQQHLMEIVTNSSTIIQNPVEIHKKDYSLLPLLAAAPQVGEKIAFKLLELTSDYSPDVSDYKCYFPYTWEECRMRMMSLIWWFWGLNQGPGPGSVSTLPLSCPHPSAQDPLSIHFHDSKLQRKMEGKILSHNPETQQVDIEILSSLPAMKEPGKFDLVYHNENGTEVVEYAVTQEKRITVFWRELIDPRLILESSSNSSATEPV